MSIVINHHVSPPARYLTTRVIPGGEHYDHIKLQISYEDWIRSQGGIVDFHPGVEWGLVSIKFENDHDAIIFKLKYM